MLLSRSGKSARSTSLGVRGCGVYSYALWEWHPRGPARGRGWLYDPTQAAITPPVDRSRTSPTFKEALSVGRRVLHRAAAGESCTLRGNRTCFPSEESLPQGVLKRPADLVLQLSIILL